jgi:NarL family two-component system response regulator LiaR
MTGRMPVPLRRAEPASGAAVRVLVVDDHVVVRQGIRALLATEPDIEVVGEAVNGREAVAETEKLRPDVILMDLVMPEMDGIEAIRRIKARQPEARILVLTSFASDDKVFPAIKAGALGYLLKDSGPEELVGAIHQVHRGESWLHPAIARKLLQELSGPSERPPTPDPLTEREVEVLQSVARGRSNQEIAEDLVISEATARAHVSNILRKLHLASRTQAALYALREGLASLEDAAPDYVSKLLGVFRDTIDSVSPGTEASPRKTTATSHASVRELESLRLIAEDYKKVGQELALAGEIQASFLPGELPHMAGWQLTATLKPARETSGDFYDFIPLSNGRLGVLVADVADKGMGAALYMALSRTLIRTYATEYDARPDLALSAVNQRILTDTHAELFVTVFYGILDPVDGRLTYCNAGHNPPYLLSAQKGEVVRELGRTGVPLGIFEDMAWEQDAAELAPGDVLVLYTDGVTEAQDQQERFFGQQRLMETARANLGRSAQDLHEALMKEVHEFVGDAPQFDDITLMVVARDS